EVLQLAGGVKIGLPALLRMGRHDIHEGADDALPECWGDLPVREGIAKCDHIVHIDTLPYRLRYGNAGVAIRELAMLHDLSQTHHDQRTGAECRQGGGHMLSVKGTETCRQAHRRMRGRGAVLQAELSRSAPHEPYHGLRRVRESLAKLSLEEIAGEGQPWRGIRKPPVWEHHHVHSCRLTQGSDE